MILLLFPWPVAAICSTSAFLNDFHQGKNSSESLDLQQAPAKTSRRAKRGRSFRNAAAPHVGSHETHSDHLDSGVTNFVHGRRGEP